MKKRISKAIGSLYGTIPSGTAALVALGVLDGAAQAWVIGLAAALVPALTFLGVYKAPANETSAEAA